MKEIKYQIYHKPTKTIQVVALIDFNNKVLDTYGINEPIYGIPFADVEWRIFTGQKDKKGILIYSRDIVSYKCDPELSLKFDPPSIHKVFWDEEYSCFRPFGIRYFFCEFSGEDVYESIPAIEVVIVGNIDQHPELLK